MDDRFDSGPFSGYLRHQYTTVVADPPWPYRDAGKETSTLIGTTWRKDGSLGIQVNHWTYQPMPLDTIKALPVAELAATPAHLYLWTTNAFIAEAHEVARAWGFEPKTILTWGKVYRDDPTRPSMKTGYYFRGATEHVVFAVRGSLRTTGTWPTLHLWPRLPHSVKPDQFYDLVQKASPGPRIDLFARKTRPDWAVWGDQVFSGVPEYAATA